MKTKRDKTMNKLRGLVPTFNMVVLNVMPMSKLKGLAAPILPDLHANRQRALVAMIPIPMLTGTGRATQNAVATTAVNQASHLLYMAARQFSDFESLIHVEAVVVVNESGREITTPETSLLWLNFPDDVGEAVARGLAAWHADLICKHCTYEAN